MLHAQAGRSVPATIVSIVNHEMKLRRIPGVAVAVVENGRVTFQRAYGMSNLETGNRAFFVTIGINGTGKVGRVELMSYQ
ncbi:MAG: hypothetical protein ACRENP_08120 [Longimicrobiales bacterium]